MDIERGRTAVGTVADFSGWSGIKAEGKFRSMNLIAKERVLGEETEQEQKQKLEKPKHWEKPEEKMETKKNFKEMPGTKEMSINPSELKSIAVRLLPTVDKVDEENYDSVCEKAIDLAFNFLKVWDLKVSIGEK